MNDVAQSTMVVSYQGIEVPDALLPEIWVLALHHVEECSLDELGRNGRLSEPVRVVGVLAAVGRLQTFVAHAEALKELLQRPQLLPVDLLSPLALLRFGGLRPRPRFGAHFDGKGPRAFSILAHLDYLEATGAHLPHVATKFRKGDV